MSYEQCTFSQELAAESFATSSLDTSQLSLLSGIDTPAKSSENEPKTDGSQACTCGKGMSDCLIHPSTPETWTAYMRASLALMCQQPENKQALALRRAVASTEKFSASLAWFDPDTCSLRMSQPSLLTDSQPSSVTLPRSGMLVNGRVYELPTVGQRTNATDGGVCFPTPTASNMPCEGTVRIMRKQWQQGLMSLEEASAIAGRDVRKAQGKVPALFPTPTSHDAKKGAYPSEYNRNTPGIAVILGGKPSPMFQEWQMGWPINHTALKASETDKFPCKPRLPGKSSEAHEPNDMRTLPKETPP